MSPDTRAVHRTPRLAPRASRIVTWAMVSLALACGGRARSDAAPGNARDRNPAVITSAEIEEMRRAGVRDLYDLVFRLRPTWLRVRIDRSLNLETTLKVYHNETPIGGIDALRGFPLLSVTTIRYLDATQAAQLTGRGSTHVDGAIIVETVTRQRDTTRVTSPAHRGDATGR